MFLTSVLDDTNLNSIRRSIFAYASVIFFVWWFNISLDLTKLPLGFVTKEASGSVVLSRLWISVFAGFSQLYLIWRIYMTYPIAVAKLDRLWGLEELTQLDGFRDAASDIEAMVERSLSANQPIKQFDTDEFLQIKRLVEHLNVANQRITPLIEENSRLSGNVTNTRARLRSLEVSLTRLREKLDSLSSDEEQNQLQLWIEEKLAAQSMSGNKKSELIPSEVDTFLENLEGFLESQSYENYDQYIRLFSDQLSQLAGLFDDIDYELRSAEEHVQYCKDFPKVFAESELSTMLNSFSSSLVNVRSKRFREFKIFEIWLPVSIAVVSLGLVGDVVFEWSTTVRNVIYEFVCTV